MGFHILQSINDRMNEQDPNVTYSTPKLAHAIERVLKSETQVVKISEIDVTMLKTRISHTTPSGSTVYDCTNSQNKTVYFYKFVQVNLTFTFQVKEFIPLLWLMP